MRYCSFTLRDHFILKNINLNNSLSVLEIGVGLGSFVDLVDGKVKEFLGIDISKEIIDYLSFCYKGRNNLSFYCLDVCKDNSNLNKSFNVIISADTLEHVASPYNFFKFVKKYLKIEGEALIIFPNESKEKHHGVTWFKDKKELVDIVESSGLRIESLQEIKETKWHRVIKFIFWKIPKLLLIKKNKNPQTFEKTNAYQIITNSGRFKMNILSFYAKMITRLAIMFPYYKYFSVDEDIKNKRLFIKLKNGK